MRHFKAHTEIAWEVDTKNFRFFALLTTLATYFLIFLGGLVRVSGAGLGCPDWPKCFGRWIPPLSATQLPADIDPGQFNFALAWIEYINRLVGVVVGILVVVVAVLALKHYRRTPRILMPSVLAAVLTAVQGWLGGRVVSSELEPIMVSAHLILALIIVSLLIYVSVRAYYELNPLAERDAAYAVPMTWGVAALWLLVLVQVILGTQIRESIEILAQSMPLLSDLGLLARVGAVKDIHTFLGIVIASLTWGIAIGLLRGSSNPSPVMWQAAWTMAGLVLLQVVFGVVLLMVGLPAVMQVLHLWLALLLSGVVLIAFAALRQAREV